MRSGRAKRRIASVLALTMTFSMIFTTGCAVLGNNSKPEPTEEEKFIESIGGVSEAYKGAVSEETYETAKAAAEAFVEEEIVGNSDCQIEKVESKGTLSKSEVSKLKLPTDIATDMTSVEKLEVEYIKEDANSYISSSSDTSNKTQKVTVYVIKYESRYKYYSPAPITGDTITKSYYDSVFNVEKYKNCTFKTTMDVDMSVEASYQGQTESANLDMSITQLVQYNEDKIYMEQSVSYQMVQAENSTQVQDKMYAYMEMVDGDLVCYVKMSGSSEWREGYIQQVGFSNLEELTPFYDQYLDYSYFTKTDYGFEISQDNAKRYIQETLSDTLGQMGLDSMLDKFAIDMFVKYYVSQGVLSGMREDVKMSMNMNQDGVTMNMTADVVAQMTCTEYGTTVVTKPFTEE